MMRKVAVFITILLASLFFAIPAMSSTTNTIIIYNTSGTTQTNRPVSITRPTCQGEIPNCYQASVNDTPVLTQTDVKNRWPDGSVKFAIVSFVIPTLPANGSVKVSFSNQATCNSTGLLSQSQMLNSAYDFDGTIIMNGANSQTVSARQILADGKFRYWLQGPVVTAVILEDRTLARAYDKDFGDGSKALHPIFEAWFYPQNKKVELGFTVENTWASSNATKAMRDLSYSLTLTSGFSNPTVEFTHPTFNHIGRSRWHKRFWIGPDPGSLRIDYNINYLVQTMAIPNYDTGITIEESLIAQYYSAWVNADKTFDGTPWSGSGTDYDGWIGNYSKSMDQAGQLDWVGLMNTWDTIYLLTMDNRMREMSLGNADLSGRFPIHFREADIAAGTGDYFDLGRTVDTFGRTVSINARKKVTLSDLAETCSGTIGDDQINTGSISNANGVANVTLNHMADVAYLPYLMTGNYYYLEELQYWASFVTGWLQGCAWESYQRQAEAGYFVGSETRGEAWALRTVSYAAFISPDGSPEKDYYDAKLRNNIARWEGSHEVPLSDPTRQAHWNFGYNNQRDSRGISPLGSWKDRGASFATPPLKMDGSVGGAGDLWEENFLVNALGMAKQFGYPTNGLLHFLAKHNFHLLLDPKATKYLIEQYKYPTIAAATGDWVQTWPEYTTFYTTVPTAWSTVISIDHGYGFIALAALSFLYDQSVDGYTGSQAWQLLKSEKPNQDKFATVSPKWAILPRSINTSLRGDVNKDNSVDILDVQSLVNHILGIQDYGTSADANDDGSADVLDVQLVVNLILGG